MAKAKKPKKITKAKLRSMARTANRKALAEWSKEVRNRDGNKCVVCGKTEYIQAHHLIPKERFPQYKFIIDNGLSLCPTCHKYGNFSFHRHPIWSVLWLEKNKLEQYNFVVSLIETDLEITNPT